MNREDYEESRCPFCKPGSTMSIPVRRVIEKLDEYLEVQDYESAEKHLVYWLSEADLAGDSRGRLSVLNEQIGLYRKTGEKENCLKAANAALETASKLNIEGSITLGTTYVNVATGFKAFGKAEEALACYEKAQVIYEKELKPGDPKLGGLYNNYALALAELRFFDKAEFLFAKALDVMSFAPGGELEQAITYCNLADLEFAKSGNELNLDSSEKIEALLSKAETLIDSPSIPRGGYYAFVCQKCAPCFEFYGYFIYSKELLKRADEILAAI